MGDFRREVMNREFPTRKHSFLSPSAHVESVVTALDAKGIRVPGHSVGGGAAVPSLRSVCVIGGGAMGSLFSALLSRVAGVSVTLVTSNVEHRRAINSLGGVVLQERSKAVTCPVVAVAPEDARHADL